MLNSTLNRAEADVKSLDELLIECKQSLKKVDTEVQLRLRMVVSVIGAAATKHIEDDDLYGISSITPSAAITSVPSPVIVTADTMDALCEVASYCESQCNALDDLIECAKRAWSIFDKYSTELNKMTMVSQGASAHMLEVEQRTAKAVYANESNTTLYNFMFGIRGVHLRIMTDTQQAFPGYIHEGSRADVHVVCHGSRANAHESANARASENASADTDECHLPLRPSLIYVTDGVTGELICNVYLAYVGDKIDAWGYMYDTRISTATVIAHRTEIALTGACRCVFHV